jgi:hypothetical protein
MTQMLTDNEQLIYGMAFLGLILIATIALLIAVVIGAL